MIINYHQYFHQRFRDQFEEWLKKSQAHQRSGGNVYIAIQDLRAKNLSHLPPQDYVLFHCALAMTVLVDQVVYTYFQSDYPKFQNLTNYPKIEYSISKINIQPWDIIHSGISLVTLEQFIDFFMAELKTFFSDHEFERLNWQRFKEAVLSDKDCLSGEPGKVLKKILQ